jgi:hypothetical protein
MANPLAQIATPPEAVQEQPLSSSRTNIAPNPTTRLDQAMEWVRTHPEESKRIDEYYEKHPEEFMQLLNGLK